MKQLTGILANMVSNFFSMVTKYLLRLHIAYKLEIRLEIHDL